MTGDMRPFSEQKKYDHNEILRNNRNKQQKENGIESTRFQRDNVLNEF